MIPFMKTTALALAAALLLFFMTAAAVVTLAVTGSLDDKSTPIVVNLVGLVVLAIPTLLAAAFAERASRDIRNGTLVEKSRQGASKALEEHGPEVARRGAEAAMSEAQVVTRTGPVVTAELLALTTILGRLDQIHPDAATEPEAEVAP